MARSSQPRRQSPKLKSMAISFTPSFFEILPNGNSPRQNGSGSSHSEKVARADAEVANRTKDEFLATLSHELRTPLNAMLGWARLLRSGNLDQEASTRALETLERNAKSQAQLIEDLLDVSRIITGKLRLDVQPVELAEIIESAVDTVRPAAEGKGIRLQLALNPRTGPVLGDPDRLQQIVWNLLSNAVKFTPKDGRVQIRLERINSHVEIAVSDTGQGINPDFLPYVFERFRQADRSSTRKHGGLGLGLAIVRHLVELHGGTAHVTSAGEGKGTTFVLKLPLMIIQTRNHLSNEVQGHKPAASPDWVSFAATPVLEGVRVLVVDDEGDARDLLSTILAQCKAEVRAVASVAEALEILGHLIPTFSLVILKCLERTVTRSLNK